MSFYIQYTSLVKKCEPTYRESLENRGFSQTNFKVMKEKIIFSIMWILRSEFFLPCKKFLIGGIIFCLVKTVIDHSIESLQAMLFPLKLMSSRCQSNILPTHSSGNLPWVRFIEIKQQQKQCKPVKGQMPYLQHLEGHPSRLWPHTSKLDFSYT